MIRQLLALLQQVGLELNAEEIADVLWLANQMGQAEPLTTQTEQPAEQGVQPSTLSTSTSSTVTEPPHPSSTPAKQQPSAAVYSSDTLPQPSTPEQQASTPKGVPFKAPAAPALRNSLALARAIRPLMRKVPSRTELVLDEEGTARQIAEKQVWAPVLQPARERWLELALVVEETRTTVVWEETIAEFQKLMERHGAFRNVYTWTLKTRTDEIQKHPVNIRGSRHRKKLTDEILLFPRRRNPIGTQRSRSPKELLEPTGRRVVLLISDCISPLWWQGKMHELLELWGNYAPVTVLQLLPEQLWERTVLGLGTSVQLGALEPGVLNSRLVVSGIPIWQEQKPKTAQTFPIVTLEPEPLSEWARVVAGVGSVQTVGAMFEPGWRELAPKSQPVTSTQPLNVELLVRRFYTTASPLAKKLAGLMAAAPVSLPVIHLIQQELLPESRQIHLAEIFMSGLLQFVQDNKETQLERGQYKFVEGVREILLGSIRITEIDAVLEKVSQYIARKAGLQIKSFAALLAPSPKWDTRIKQEIIPFAQIATQVLRQLGEEYAVLADRLERGHSNLHPVFPNIQTFEFEVATITIEDGTETHPAINLQPFAFEVAIIEIRKAGWFRQKTELIIRQNRHQAQCFIEDLGNEVQLEMVSISEGSFVMGSPEDEKEHSFNESPQHKVNIKSFFIGKYPITQAQWQAVASLPEVNCKLKPDPSIFKGSTRPVECISWYDAVEFCSRITQKTGREYRLPSEAEWEYACRAGTTTPFHFGETITTDLANYDGNYTYGQGSEGVYRKETTPVGSFGVANAFGLYDMHGNVWEWCADHWHGSYEGAPTDGSIWLSSVENKRRLRRGGSWSNNPENCRSAYRGSTFPDVRDNFFGFRVVCAVA